MLVSVVWGDTVVYAAFSTELQREIELAWTRGEATMFFVPDSDQTWKVDLNSMTMQRVTCREECQHTRPIRRVFVPAGTAYEVRESSESRTPVEWT